MKKGDRLRVETPSGAGCGDPLTRDVAVVLADIQDDRITPEHARRYYGVCVREGVVDLVHTRDLRRGVTRS